MKKNSFVVGALIIAISNLLVKLIGAVYKIPLDRLILGPEGMGIYSSSYTIYNMLFVISTAGLPVAISKMIAEAEAKREYKKSEKIFKISRALLFCLGLGAFCILFFFSKFFANIISSPDSYVTMMAMAPSLFFVSLASSYRGYFQGKQNMLPTAVSEVIEALSKLIFGLSLAYIVKLNFDKYYLSSAGAIAGVSIGTCLSFLFLAVYGLTVKRKNRVKVSEFSADRCDESSLSILKRLIAMAVPITLGVCVFTLTSLIDTATVMNQLKNLGYDELNRSTLYGYLNRAITLFNMPPTVINAIAISIVPSVASFLAVGNRKSALKNTKTALKITVIFALPCAIGLSVLARPILNLLYGDPNHSFLLNIMGIAVLFVTVVQISNAILQSWGNVWTPVINMLVGGIVKVVLNLYLVSKPEININGAPIGTLMCYITVMTLNVVALIRKTSVKLGFADFIFKPVILTVVTAASAYLSFDFIAGIITSEAIALFLSIGFTAVIYFVFLFLLRGISEDEILLIPKGEKLLSILKKFHIM